MTTVYSFDVFDTLITRRTATPQGIFIMMKHHLHMYHAQEFSASFIEEFFHLRINAEKKARVGIQREEIFFEDIYNELQREFQLTDHQKECLKNLELQLEKENLMGIPNHIAQVHSLFDQGYRVILISDMYLRQDFLVSILKNIDEQFGKYPLYLSSEIGLTKGSGRLFEYVLQQEKIAPHELHHIGDNRYSDFKKPKSMGIRATRCKATDFNDYEKSYFYDEYAFSHQLLVGCSRKFRIEHPSAAEQEIIGSSFTGPLLYDFIASTLSKAKALGIKRLFFLARDGYIMLKMAAIINEKFQYGLDLKYLYAARQVCHLAAVYRITRKEVDLFTQRFKRVSISSIAKRFQMTPEELFEMLPGELKKLFLSPDHYLSRKKLKKFQRFLLTNSEIQAVIVEKAKKHRELFLKYLEQEHFFNDPVTGIVDLGWTGQMQDCFYLAASERKHDIILHGFYYSLYCFTESTTTFNQKHYYIEANYLRTYDDILPYRNLLECLTQADHSTTKEYFLDGDTIKPKIHSNEEIIQWGIDKYYAAVEAFTKDYTEMKYQFPLMVSVARFDFPKMFQVLCKPTVEFAACLGNIRFAEGPNDHFKEQLVFPFTLKTLLLYFLSAKFRRQLMWPQGSAVCSPWYWRILFNIYDTMAHSFFGIYKNIKIKMKKMEQNIRKHIKKQR